MKQTSWTLYRVVVVGVESVEERRVQCGRLPEATPPSLGNCGEGRPTPSDSGSSCRASRPTRADYVILHWQYNCFFYLQPHLHLASCLHLAALSSLKHTQPPTVSLLLHKISQSRLPLGRAGKGWRVGVMCSVLNSVLYCRRHACLHVRSRSPTLSIYLS